MGTISVVYGTGEGHTEKVAGRVGETVEARGHTCTVTDVDSVTGDSGAELVENSDAVIVGSSVHASKHHGAIVAFVRDNRSALAAVPTAFFQVSLASAVDDDEWRANAAAYVDTMLESTGFDPDRIALFGGALRYSKYGFLKRLLMKQLAKRATGDVDTSRDFEYTDWDEVEAFANDFAAFVEGRRGSAPG